MRSLSSDSGVGFPSTTSYRLGRMKSAATPSRRISFSIFPHPLHWKCMTSHPSHLWRPLHPIILGQIPMPEGMAFRSCTTASALER